MTKKVLLLSLLNFFYFQTVYAAIYVEPIAGLKMVGENEHASSYYLAFGGRLGYSTLGFIIGAEYIRSSEQQVLSSFVSYKLPVIPIRALARLILDGGQDYINTLYPIEYDVPNGFGLGVSFTGIPLFAITLDYNWFTADPSLASPTESTKKFQEIFLCASMPFEF